jgi:hypothetical protein
VSKTSITRKNISNSYSINIQGNYVENPTTYSNLAVQSQSKVIPSAVPVCSYESNDNSSRYLTTYSSSRESYRTLNDVLSGNKYKR